MVSRISVEDVGAGVKMDACRGLRIVGASLSANVAEEIATLVIALLQGTADPTVGAGVAHAMPCLYARNNAGVTELWVATGTGPTQWTKVTVP